MIERVERISMINNCVLKEKRDAELSKINRENSKEEQGKLLELEKIKLELANALLELVRCQAGGNSSNLGVDGLNGNSLEALIKRVKMLILAVLTKLDIEFIFIFFFVS